MSILSNVLSEITEDYSEADNKKFLNDVNKAIRNARAEINSGPSREMPSYEKDKLIYMNPVRWIKDFSLKFSNFIEQKLAKVKPEKLESVTKTGSNPIDYYDIECLIMLTKNETMLKVWSELARSEDKYLHKYCDEILNNLKHHFTTSNL